MGNSTMNFLSSLWRKKDGIAATEFALLLPIMILLFFGMVEGSDALTVSRRLSNATNSIADLAARQAEISQAEIDDIMIGVTRQLEPTDVSQLSIKLVSVEIDPQDSNSLIVHWSRDNEQGEPYAPGSIYNGVDDITTLRAPNTLIVVEVDYTYASGLTNFVFDNPIDFAYKAKRWPRLTSRTQICDNYNDQLNDYENCTS